MSNHARHKCSSLINAEHTVSESDSTIRRSKSVTTGKANVALNGNRNLELFAKETSSLLSSRMASGHNNRAISEYCASQAEQAIHKNRKAGPSEEPHCRRLPFCASSLRFLLLLFSFHLVITSSIASTIFLHRQHVTHPCMTRDNVQFPSRIPASRFRLVASPAQPQ